ncbi:hypothetical protein Nhal_1055 [Nitrosococcus halophilus Nc 4]|uniref:Uncharacterized protein n=1 Tax=Nitrosococcus halophilus (strain Nc4) TaxID=472759 RepID=D5BZ14_NITHN|nr:hypothetical protein [Nitrosococcus halophilus]ADE14227.1 hypothetical protein Nhal_1055 [Nitrosococcus halophilus Nc 4]
MSIPVVMNPLTTSAFPQAKEPAQEISSNPEFKPFGEDGLTFGDLLDVVNPLHHLPVVGSFYRELSGDTIDPASRLAGSALFGGPIGAAVAAANVALEHFSGDDIEGHVVALLHQEPREEVLSQAAVSIESVASSLDAGPLKSQGPEESLTAGLENASVQVASRGVAPANERYSHRPGGWLVGAAHAGIDAYREALTAKKEDPLTINKTV